MVPQVLVVLVRGVSKTSVSKGPNAIGQPRETSSFDADDSWETSKRVFQVFIVPAAD